MCAAQRRREEPTERLYTRGLSVHIALRAHHHGVHGVGPAGGGDGVPAQLTTPSYAFSALGGAGCGADAYTGNEAAMLLVNDRDSFASSSASSGSDSYSSYRLNHGLSARSARCATRRRYCPAEPSKPCAATADSRSTPRRGCRYLSESENRLGGTCARTGTAGGTARGGGNGARDRS